MSSSTFRPRAASLRSRTVAAVAARTLRPVTRVIPARGPGIWFTRGVLAGSLLVGGTRARGASVVPIDTTIVGRGRVRGEWVRPPGTRAEAPRTAGVVLYVHGSAYVGCSVATHRGLVSRIAQQTGADVFSVEYRLAPRHRFPAAVDDVERAYTWLLDQGVPADRVVLMGDSAGGHLVVDLALELVRSGGPAPAALVLFSPLVDHTFALARARETLRPDPLVTADAARRLIDRYAEGLDLAHPRLAHGFAHGETLPPTLIQAGGAEMLAADAHALHRKLRATGTPATLEVWPGQLHVFQALPRLVPEAEPALRRATDFVRARLAEQPLGVVEEISA